MSITHCVTSHEASRGFAKRVRLPEEMPQVVSAKVISNADMEYILSGFALLQS